MYKEKAWKEEETDRDKSVVKYNLLLLNVIGILYFQHIYLFRKRSKFKITLVSIITFLANLRARGGLAEYLRGK